MKSQIDCVTIGQAWFYVRVVFLLGSSLDLKGGDRMFKRILGILSIILISLQILVNLTNLIDWFNAKKTEQPHRECGCSFKKNKY